MCRSTVPGWPPLAAEQIEAERNRVRTLLRRSGHAVTPQRMATLDVLLQTNDHICAEHTLGAIQSAHPTWRVNKTTIYRTLDLLLALGVIYEMRRDDGRAEYELALHGPHGHLVCQQCGRLQNIAPATAALLHKELQERYGFEIDLVNHALVGLCEHCSHEQG